MKWLWTRWPWLPPSRGDVLAIAFGIALLVALVIGLFYRPWLQWAPRNTGFGPDWDCVYVPQGDPICFKRPPAKRLGGAEPSQ